MLLPNLDQAEITEQKLTAYLLAVNHRDGRGKAEFFLAHGFTIDNWRQFAQALRTHAAQHKVAKMETNAFGTRYVIEGAIAAPDNRHPLVRVLWFVENNADTPLLCRNLYAAMRIDRA